ncbi:MAG: hypothetical protein TEF_14400 [Rhizobiales bacterium NRL2]|nr:MAG: hypothetical protein TEF_14400 [Rhizobiales bacterium NRL2]
MALRVMGWRRQLTPGIRPLPIRLTFAAGSMAGCAVLLVHPASRFYSFRVQRGRAAIRQHTTRIKRQQHHGTFQQ